MIRRAAAVLLIGVACKSTPTEATPPASSAADPNAAAPATATPAAATGPASPAPAPQASPASAPAASGTGPLERLPGGRVGVGPFAMQVPADWTEVPRSSNMRAAHFKLPAPKGSKAEVIVYYFGQSGAGSVQDNIDRWLSQFQQPDGKPSREAAKIEKTRLGGRDVTLVSVSGRYIAPPTPGGTTPSDLPDQSLVAAIVESPSGPYYFRLLGPRSVVTAQTAAFRSSLESLTAR